MIHVRISSETSRQFDSLKARMSRLQAALGSGATTTEQLARAKAECAAMAPEFKALQLMLGVEIAEAKQRERDDRKPPAEPIPFKGAGGLRAGRGRS